MNDSYMRKFLLFFFSIFVLTVMAEKTIYLHKTDGTKETYLASTVDSIGFVNAHTITFNANGGTGSMDVLCVKEGESITLPTNRFAYAKAEFAGWSTAANGSGTAYADKATVKPTANITLYAQWKSTTSGFANGHEWVDLGLPSGTKWATCNVGANAPEDYGYYFAWGETAPSSYSGSFLYYYVDTYKWYDPYIKLTKYCLDSDYGKVDYKKKLELTDDAANANWGGDWRMPTKAEQDELINKSYTTWTWTTQNGVEGYKVTSKINGNSIFLPAAGFRLYEYLRDAGSCGYYWTSSLYLDNSYISYYLYLSYQKVEYPIDNGERWIGYSVRPVLAK